MAITNRDRVINYTLAYPCKAQRFKAGLDDAKEWLGEHRFNTAAALMSHGDMKPSFIRNTISMMTGLSGYPVDCMLRMYHGRYRTLVGSKANAS